MKKTTLLGICNLVFASWFLYILFTSNYSWDRFSSLYVIVKNYASLLVIFLFLLINSYLTYLLFRKVPKKVNYPVLTALTFAPFFWFIFVFVAFSFASQPFLPILTIILSVLFYVFFKKYSPKAALFLSLGTCFVMLMVLLSSFEEDYCWKKGDSVDRAGTKFIAASRDDAKKLKGYGVTTGQQIGVSFRTHMLCHQTFDLGQAIKASYFHR